MLKSEKSLKSLNLLTVVLYFTGNNTCTIEFKTPLRSERVTSLPLGKCSMGTSFGYTVPCDKLDHNFGKIWYVARH